MGAVCAYDVRNNLRWTVDTGCRQFIQCQNHRQGTLSQRCSQLIRSENPPSGDCQPEVQPFHTESEPTSRGLLVGMQSIYMVKNPPEGDSWPRMQSVYIVSEPTFRRLLAGMQPVYTVSDSQKETVVPGRSLFKQCQKLTPGDCSSR